MDTKKPDGEVGYLAFISYAREDEAFARQLETEIEAHQRPGTGAAVRVFRDRSDFTGSAYESALEGHLRNSATLIVVCSPDARKSAFVGDEIRRFAALHGADRIFPVLVSGLADNEAEDRKAFPRALLEVMQERGMPLGAEYRGINLRRERVGGGRFEGEWYKLLANIYGVTPAEIREQDQRHQIHVQRKKLFATAVVAGLLFVALGLAVYLWLWQRDLAKRESMMSAISQTELALSTREPATAMAPSAPSDSARQPVPPPPVAAPASGAWPSAAQVYLHIRDEQQRPGAQEVKSRLERSGLDLVVPGIERLDVGPTRTSELRVFREVDRAEAERIADVLRAGGVSDLAVKKIPGYEDSPKLRPRHFEVWLKPRDPKDTP